MNEKKHSKLAYYMGLAESGTARDIDLIMRDLNEDMSFADSRFIDYALSLVSSPEGIEAIGNYLFNGTQIQRNYCTLFFNRRNDWSIVKRAFELGLIDAKQAYSR
jgi:hypothetical protein